VLRENPDVTRSFALIHRSVAVTWHDMPSGDQSNEVSLAVASSLFRSDLFFHVGWSEHKLPRSIHWWIIIIPFMNLGLSFPILKYNQLN
jgi:hypothetical protein